VRIERTCPANQSKRRRTVTTTSTTIRKQTARVALRDAPWARVCAGCLAAGVAALIGIELYAVVLHIGGVPLRAGFLGARTAKPVTYGSFAVGILVGTSWGTIAALLIARFARRPRATFLTVAVAATALSLIVPLGAGATATETRIVLALGHLLVAAIMIPIIASRLAAHQARRHEPRPAGR
jgi:Family of unknown function (DUF6069)